MSIDKANHEEQMTQEERPYRCGAFDANIHHLVNGRPDQCILESDHECDHILESEATTSQILLAQQRVFHHVDIKNNLKKESMEITVEQMRTAIEDLPDDSVIQFRGWQGTQLTPHEHWIDTSVRPKQFVITFEEIR